jgi:hypothetical protein
MHRPSALTSPRRESGVEGTSTPHLRGGLVTVLIAALLAASGCQKAEPAPLAPVNSAEAVEVVLQAGPPPVEPQAELEPLLGDEAARRYFMFDLNGDGAAEYFVENGAGGHGISLALVDCQGRPLTRPEDFVGGDLIYITRSSHHGYRDLVCSYMTACTVDYDLWEFDGTCYVIRQSWHSKNFDDVETLANGQLGGAVAIWYADPPDWLRHCPKEGPCVDSP